MKHFLGLYELSTFSPVTKNGRAATPRWLAAVALAVSLWAGAFASARADVIFNEVMADNQTAFANGEDFPDWIELYNDSTTTDVSLNGWSLTDDPARPRKWVFPNTTTNQPPDAPVHLLRWPDERQRAARLDQPERQW